MEIPDGLLCMFSGEVRERNGSYIVEIPAKEVVDGGVEEGAVYRVALLGEAPPKDAGERGDRGATPSGPPVEQGEERTVEIEGHGDQGDGIARVERGYVIIVPDTEKGERVTVEISEVTENVGFAEVVTRHDYYE